MRLSARAWILLGLAVASTGALAWAGLTPSAPSAREELHVIPKGTWARRAAGAKQDTFPSRIQLTLGVKDILVLRNDDEVPQMFGPVLIMPGQSYRLPFTQVSSNQFACTAHVNGQLVVDVAPPPPAWTLFRLRLAALLPGQAATQ